MRKKSWRHRDREGEKHVWLKWLGRFNEIGVTPSSYCGCSADAIEIEGLCFIFRSNCQLQYVFLFIFLCITIGTSRAICKFFSFFFFQKQILTMEKCLIKSKMRREHCIHISLYVAHIDIFRSKCNASKKTHTQTKSEYTKDRKKMSTVATRIKEYRWCETEKPHTKWLLVALTIYCKWLRISPTVPLSLCGLFSHSLSLSLNFVFMLHTQSFNHSVDSFYLE